MLRERLRAGRIEGRDEPRDRLLGLEDLAAVDGGSGASASSGSSGSSGVSKENDERLQLLEIERMMQKTNQMFATISNILKATHDAAMTAVNNIR